MSTRAPAVAVTGLGLITPAGVDRDATWAGLSAGVRVAAKDPVLAGLPVDFSCAVPESAGVAALVPGRARRMDPYSRLAVLAAREAVADAGLTPREWPAERVGVVLGVGNSSMLAWPSTFAHLTAGRPERVAPTALPRSMPNTPVAEVTIDLAARGPSFAVAGACASGGYAIAVASDLLRSGTCDIVITGGAESARSTAASACLSQLTALSRHRHDPAGASRPFDAHRDGFVLGEGAGILVLERLEQARARRVTPRALLAGHGSSSDAHHYVSPDPQGAGAERALRAALSHAGLTADDIDHVNAHATSTPVGDLAEARALRRVFGDCPPPVTAVKSVIGHALGGAGGIEAAVTVLSLQEQAVPPTVNLDRLDPEVDLDIIRDERRAVRMRSAVSNSFGFGGHNVVLVFSAA
ncbi:beta-ketoacyl-[acyl-carrier-protein] synthase family protein [Streptomyces sp. NPDC003032]